MQRKRRNAITHSNISEKKNANNPFNISEKKIVDSDESEDENSDEDDGLLLK